MCRGDAGGVLALALAADVVAGDRGRGGRPGIVSTMCYLMLLEGSAFGTWPAVGYCSSMHVDVGRPAEMRRSSWFREKALHKYLTSFKYHKEKHPNCRNR